MRSKKITAEDFLLQRELKIRNARKNFYEYCKAIIPKQYTANRPYLKDMCDTYQALYEGTLINPNTGKPYRRMMVNVPPRHLKSLTVQLFSQWLLGKDNENRIITVSYNEKMSSRFAKFVRDKIQEESKEPDQLSFSDIFPTTKIKYGDSSVQMWSLEGQHFNYLATSFNGTLTGAGCNIGIIDDPVKDSYEALNESILQDQWDWYVDTYLSRLQNGATPPIQIIIMTRWASKDLCGRLLDEPDGDTWYVMKLKARNEETNEMLCDDILSLEAYEYLRSKTSAPIMLANYQQEPIDLVGRLYQQLKTYKEIPKDESGNSLFERILAFIDTADKGEDYLCAVVVGLYQGEAYVIDALYTQEPMKFTEIKTAKLLHKNNVNLAIFESNNGGEGFARNVERIIWETYNSRSVVIRTRPTTQNKQTRIKVQSSFIEEHFYFPLNWHDRFPEFHTAVISYQAVGKNAHDDAPDALTSIAELLSKGLRKEKRKGRKLSFG